MKEKMMYQCEICNEIYDSPEKAVNCESKGIQTPSINVGQKFNYLEGIIEGFGHEVYTPCVVLEVVTKDHYVFYICNEINSHTNEIWQENIKFNVFEEELEKCELI
jgi:hypothetical protein